MKVICSTSPWRGDLDYALSRIKALGFSEVDLIVIESWGHVSLSALVADFETEAARVEGLLAKHGLTARGVNAAFGPDLNRREDAAGNAERIVQMETLLKFMKRLGITRGGHYPGHIADWKNDAEGVWRDTTASLREIQAVFAGSGIPFGPELHSCTPFETPALARRLLAEIPEIPYTMDISHFIMLGHAWEETADLLDNASNVHLRGCLPGRLQTAPVGDAADNVRKTFARLRASGYLGNASIEYLPKGEGPMDFDIEAAIADTAKLAE